MVAEVVAACKVDHLAEVAVVDGGAAFLQTSRAPHEGAGAVVELLSAFLHAVDLVGPFFGEFLGFVFFAEDSAEHFDGFGGVFQRVLAEVGDDVLDFCVVELLQQAVGAGGLVGVGAHDDNVGVEGEEVFDGDVAVVHVADRGDVGELRNRLFEVVVVAGG